MIRTSGPARRVLAVLVALISVAAAAGLAVSSAGAQGTPPDGKGTAGPPSPYEYATELMGEELGKKLVPLVNKAMITRSKYGYLFRAGQQHTRLTITQTDAGLWFVDRRTRSWKRLARGCHAVKVRRGVGAVCRVPATISEQAPLLIEVWPRLGNDHVDGHTLPATFSMTVLGDDGNERVRFGSGPDFFNGFTGTDRVWGGAGDDWIRSGQDDDIVHGGDGDDQLVDSHADDVLYGGNGDDRIGGGPGRDRIDGGAGADRLYCGPGADDAVSDADDLRLLDC
jgi:hypothetical protein